MKFKIISTCEAARRKPCKIQWIIWGKLRGIQYNAEKQRAVSRRQKLKTETIFNFWHFLKRAALTDPPRQAEGLEGPRGTRMGCREIAISVILLIIFLIINIARSPIFAQIPAKLDFFYIFAKKVEGGVLLGVEIQASQGNRVLTSDNFTFKWVASAGSIFEATSRSSTIKIPAKAGVRDMGGVVKAMSYDGNVQFDRNFSFALPAPRVSLARFNPKLNLILPLTNKIDSTDSLVAFVFDFFKRSQGLNYFWNVGGVKTEGQQMVEVKLIPAGQTIEVSVQDPENSIDYAVEQRLINF